jgi:phage-related protein
MNATWSIEFINANAEKEVMELSAEFKAKFLHVTELLLKFGPINIGLPHVRTLGGKLWELRMKSKTGIARSIYVLEHEKRIIILHTFVKKTQKTPKLALDIAMKRRKELKT